MVTDPASSGPTPMAPVEAAPPGAGHPRRPVRLAPNTVPSFYPGAGRIARFRRRPDLDPTHPEDWIASTAARTGLAPSGMTVLDDGTLLQDAFHADPIGWFGPQHLARYGPSGGLLVKLLDAGQRLPLHVHPSRAFARTNLHQPFGKTEAWVIVDAAPGAFVHLGFSRDIDTGELRRWVTTQDTAAMLAATNKIPVSAGDVLLCPAGVPHAIGAGILTIELQEPTDFSIMLEWRDYPLDPQTAFLGLDPDLALTAVHRGGISDQALDRLRGQPLGTHPGGHSLLPPAADEFFTAIQVNPHTGYHLDRRLSLLIIHNGTGTLRCDSEATVAPIAVAAGETYLIPHAAGPTVLAGELSAIRCSAA